MRPSTEARAALGVRVVKEVRGTQQPRAGIARKGVPVRAGLRFKGETKSRGSLELLELQSAGPDLSTPVELHCPAGHRKVLGSVCHRASSASVVRLVFPGGQGLCWFANGFPGSTRGPHVRCGKDSAAASSSTSIASTAGMDSRGVVQLQPSSRRPFQLQVVPATTCRVGIRSSPQPFSLRDHSGGEAGRQEGTHHALHCEAPGSPVQCHRGVCS